MQMLLKKNRLPSRLGSALASRNCRTSAGLLRRRADRFHWWSTSI